MDNSISTYEDFMKSIGVNPIKTNPLPPIKSNYNNKDQLTNDNSDVELLSTYHSSQSSCVTCVNCDLVLPGVLEAAQHTITCKIPLNKFTESRGNKKNIKTKDPKDGIILEGTAGDGSYELIEFQGTISESKDIKVSEVVRKTYKKPTVKASAREKPYKCMECEKSFTSKQNLNKHLALHRSGKKYFVCPVCERSFSQRANLNSHAKTHEPDYCDKLKKYKCSQCDYKDLKKSNLVRHRLTHTDVKEFECQECGNKFSRKVNLFKHMVIHTGERPFKCSTCDDSFTVKYDLIQHERLAHTGENPFVCNICNKICDAKDDLDIHIKNAHKDKLKFSCMLCSYVGKSGPDIYLHMMNGHTMKKPRPQERGRKAKRNCKRKLKELINDDFVIIVDSDREFDETEVEEAEIDVDCPDSIVVSVIECEVSGEGLSPYQGSVCDQETT